MLGARAGGALGAVAGSPDQGGRWEGWKYLCSHLNVNQVWLERGSRDTEEGGESESPRGEKRQRWGW